MADGFAAVVAALGEHNHQLKEERTRAMDALVDMALERGLLLHVMRRIRDSSEWFEAWGMADAVLKEIDGH